MSDLPSPATGSSPGEEEEAHLVDRDLSWLAFNGRVLQEAADPSVPLFDRLGFLAIFSSNLDEFFRVRVAWLRSLLRLRRKRVKRLRTNPLELLAEIHRLVDEQQERFGEIFATGILPELERRGVHLVAPDALDPVRLERLRVFARDEVLSVLTRVDLPGEGDTPVFLEDRAVHLVVEHRPEEVQPLAPAPLALSLVAVPAPPLDRFVVLERDDHGFDVLFLDDIVRLALPALFRGRALAGAWAVKLSRDAELYLEDEFEGDVVAAIRRSLEKRRTGTPCRFLYDPATPVGVLERLQSGLGLEPEDLVPGGRYHNLDDLRRFPRCGIEDESYPEWSHVPMPDFDDDRPVAEVIATGDRLLHFPYHDYRPVVRFLTEAAADPRVREIWLTVYRVSRDSAVLRALLDAAERGKTVHVFVEVKARFDEAANLAWAERLEEAGVRILFSPSDLKVHAKIALVVRTEPEGVVRHAYLGTGNFNEETARLYTDFALLTADPRITDDVERVFHVLAGDVDRAECEELLVAPFQLRKRLAALIDFEIEHARRGGPSGITFKLNALEDEEVIHHLYRASKAGVPIRGVVRGICRMVPEAVGRHAPVELRSIVDRYLEHGRVYAFHHGGETRVYLSSADWMYRNLSRRIEVAFPIRDPSIRDWILEVVELQLADNRKARVLDADGRNRYHTSDRPPLRSQEAIRDRLAELVTPSTVSGS